MNKVKIILNIIVLSLIGIVVWHNTTSKGQNYHINTSSVKSWLTNGMFAVTIIILIIGAIISLMIHFLPAGEHDDEI